MNENLHKLIGTKMKSGARGVRGMSTKNMEKFIKNHGQSVLRIKKDRMSLGSIFTQFKEGKNMLEKGRNSPKKVASPKKNANFNMMKVKRNWANDNNNGKLPSLPASPVSSKGSNNENNNLRRETKFYPDPKHYSRVEKPPKPGSVNIFPVKGYRKPLSKVRVVPKRTYLQVMIGPGKGTERVKAYNRPIMGKFPKEIEYNAPVGKSVSRKGVVPFNTTHFRPLRSPTKQSVAPSIPRKEPFVLKKFLESIKSKK
jgi:hypothetical protein